MFDLDELVNHAIQPTMERLDYAIAKAETMITNPIAQLNDRFRKAPPNRDWFLTKEAKDQAVNLLDAIAIFDNFSEDNDPYGEHDFGSIEIDDEEYFWKIDYFDLDRDCGSEDPSNPSLTRRVMTIMHSSEY